MNLLSKFGRATLLLWIACLLPTPIGRAQQSLWPKQVLVLYWEDQNHPANIDFARDLRANLQSLAPGGIEYYSEFLEALRQRSGGPCLQHSRHIRNI